MVDAQLHAPSRVGDARLALGVASVGTVALVLFVLVPGSSSDSRAPGGLDVLWELGTVATVLLAPVATGLAAYVGFVALWRRGGVMSTSERRSWLLVLVVAAVFFVGLAVAWGDGSLTWLDD